MHFLPAPKSNKTLDSYYSGYLFCCGTKSCETDYKTDNLFKCLFHGPSTCRDVCHRSLSRWMSHVKTIKYAEASAKTGEGRGSQHNLFRFCSTHFAFSIRWHHFRSVDCHITRAVCSFLTRHTSICILSWAWIPVHVHHFHMWEHFCARDIVIIFLSLSHSLGTRVHHKLQQKNNMLCHHKAFCRQLRIYYFSHITSHIMHEAKAHIDHCSWTWICMYKWRRIFALLNPKCFGIIIC